MNNPIIPVILCGGAGTRLWPLSRASYPKQFLSLNSSNNKSLLQNTYERISELDNIQMPIILCNEEHRFIVAEQMRGLNIKPNSIILEPFGRNTAPAIALAALKSIEIEKDPILLVLSSDHEIKNNERFLDVLTKGIDYVLEDKLITFGIIPSSPEVGYGYIKSEKPFNSSKIEGHKIIEFIEKPDLETAKTFVQNKCYTWNSGMFMFKAKNILEEINVYSPNILKSCREAINKSVLDLDFERLGTEEFKSCQDISIDFAVMEKTKKGVVLPLDAGWSDIGSWQSVWENSKKNQEGNFFLGNTLIEDSQNCYIRSENRLVAGLGLNNLVVIETNDAILIADKNKSQGIKNIVKKLKERKIPQGQQHLKIYRPWGHYLSIVEESRWQVKLIFVKPGEKLSLQMHHHRSEHWIVVKGTAEVEINDKRELLSENESTYIPLGSPHRLINPGKIPLTIIEVQSGSYVGEDDIVRFEDKYGRSK